MLHYEKMCLWVICSQEGSEQPVHLQSDQTLYCHYVSWDPKPCLGQRVRALKYETEQMCRLIQVNTGCTCLDPFCYCRAQIYMESEWTFLLTDWLVLTVWRATVIPDFFLIGPLGFSSFCLPQTWTMKADSFRKVTDWKHKQAKKIRHHRRNF